ncbi:Peptide deformylase-like [Homarus americanus]|uniref:Peptide deformylase-like n=1 Tax=Homarus americanus TaxID=6706 RepID=A0A8J5N0Y8_HOMAM|nr:Peptide deformylase-like [Homarus americanus]
MAFKRFAAAYRSFFFPTPLKPPFLHICQAGDPVLRSQAKPVSHELVNTPEIQQDKLIAFSLKYNVDATSKSSSVGARKLMRVAKDTNLEEVVTKWFVQQ